jgi:hypothetical protein
MSSIDDPQILAQILGYHIKHKNINTKDALKHISKTAGGSFFGDLANIIPDVFGVVPGVSQIGHSVREAIDPYVNEEDKLHKSITKSYRTISDKYTGWNDWRLLDDIQRGYISNRSAIKMFGRKPDKNKMAVEGGVLYTKQERHYKKNIEIVPEGMEYRM